ncbi:CLUMA_CG004560, isoform A [Clunio marinus]|uniref:CLUMA_CG004560, isoform A n=1 Tax=Clunio marinus TaxID=568069 RepID=A0A1J1HWH3_9DIPT|nr:CLUMA_CG004560, isoform A [Clunio marinus]
MDALYLSQRILISSDCCKKLISGGILVSNTDGTIKRVFTSQEEINSYLFIEHGAEVVYDFGNKVIMPGLIDANVNICSGTDVEDFSTVTKAAAAGGFTCIVDNPMFSVPATTSLKNLKAKVDQARKNCLHVDVAFWGGVTGENNSELLPLAHHGVCGFKGILNPQDSFPDFPHLTKDSLKSSLEVLEETDCVLALKPDLEEQESSFPNDVKFKDYAMFLSTKPSSIEKIGVQLVLDLIKNHKMKIHLTDLSSAEIFPLMQKYQNMKTPKMSSLSYETSHHYLALNAEDIGNGKTEFKCSPPIRNHNNQSSLWEKIKNYEIFNVSSSHLPSSIKSKCLIGGKNRGNFFEASNGISSLQFSLPVFWTNCHKHDMTLHDVSRFLSYHPAKLCGLDKNKGRIQIGYDGDFCVWDPDEEWTVTKEDTLFKNKICPYYGKVLKGRVYATVVRGYFVFDVNNPQFDEPMGNVLLKKPMRRCERSINFQDDDLET